MIRGCERLLADRNASLCPPVAGYLSECVTSTGKEGCGGSPVTAAAKVCICVRECACVSG